MAYGNNPLLHRIEVEHEVFDGEIVDTNVRFLCDGGRAAPCHNYPGCDCEEWEAANHSMDPSTAADPGHENVPHDNCWMEPHLNNVGAWEIAESMDCSVDDLRSGHVDLSWEGDGAFTITILDPTDPRLSEGVQA